jgi:hypothetical protein
LMCAQEQATQCPHSCAVFDTTMQVRAN